MCSFKVGYMEGSSHAESARPFVTSELLLLSSAETHTYMYPFLVTFPSKWVYFCFPNCSHLILANTKMISLSPNLWSVRSGKYVSMYTTTFKCKHTDGESGHCADLSRPFLNVYCSVLQEESRGWMCRMYRPAARSAFTVTQRRENTDEMWEPWTTCFLKIQVCHRLFVLDIRKRLFS